jgi:four helix bundle protein
MDRNDPKGIDERSFYFYRDVLTFVETIREGPKTKDIIEQLVAAAGSIGANREEARGASTRKEFIRFNEVALRGANESVRWLRACAAKRLGDREKCVALLDEARQLARILGRMSSRQNEETQATPDFAPSPGYFRTWYLARGTWHVVPST